MKLEELKSRQDIGLVLNTMGLTKLGIEVGVAFGENAEHILQHSKLDALYLVDPWAYVPDQNPVGYGDVIKNWEECYRYCLKKLSPYKGRYEILRMSSRDASELVEDGEADFIYIDSNHMSPYIDDDLALWYPKVNIGGIFGGHDYYNKNTEGFICNVKTAVDNFVNKHGLELILLPEEDSSWYVVAA